MNAPCSIRLRKDLANVKLRICALAAVILLSACHRTGDISAENGGGVYAVRSVCPIAGIPTGTGDITLFNPEGSTDASAIDVTAAITNVRSACQEGTSDVISTVTFDVVGQRRDAGAARQVVLPYFDVALRGGDNVAAKQVGGAVLNFPAGQSRASVRLSASIRVNRGAATLPTTVRANLTKVRKAGDADAALDPMSDPAIRLAVANATFEHLVGFALSQDQLRYNATR
jgi:hypothetical protein